MKKLWAAVLAGVLTVAMLAGCSPLGANQSSSHPDGDDQSYTDSQEGEAQGDPSGPPKIEGTEKLFAGIISSGRYTMKYRVVVESTAYEVTHVVTAGKIAEMSKEEEYDIRTIFMNGKGYIVNDTLQMYRVLPEFKAAGDMFIELAGLSSSGVVGEELFNGENLSFEEYAFDNGVMRLYAGEEGLVGIRITQEGEDADPESIDLIILDFSGTVDESAFDIPSDYAMVS